MNLLKISFFLSLCLLFSSCSSAKEWRASTLKQLRSAVVESRDPMTMSYPRYHTPEGVSPEEKKAFLAAYKTFFNSYSAIAYDYRDLPADNVKKSSQFSNYAASLLF